MLSGVSCKSLHTSCSSAKLSIQNSYFETGKGAELLCKIWQESDSGPHKFTQAEPSRKTSKAFNALDAPLHLKAFACFSNSFPACSAAYLFTRYHAGLGNRVAICTLYTISHRQQIIERPPATSKQNEIRVKLWLAQKQRPSIDGLSPNRPDKRLQCHFH